MSAASAAIGNMREILSMPPLESRAWDELLPDHHKRLLLELAGKPYLSKVSWESMNSEQRAAIRRAATTAASWAKYFT